MAFGLLLCELCLCICCETRWRLMAYDVVLCIIFSESCLDVLLSCNTRLRLSHMQIVFVSLSNVTEHYLVRVCRTSSAASNIYSFADDYSTTCCNTFTVCLCGWWLGRACISLSHSSAVPGQSWVPGTAFRARNPILRCSAVNPTGIMCKIPCCAA